MEDEEIDLLTLYKVFKRTRFYIMIQHNFEFILKNIILLILFVVIGSVSGYLLEKRNPGIFRSEMIIKSKLVDNHVSKEIVLDLNNLIIDQNYKELEKYGLEQEDLEQISQIDFLYPEVNNNEAIKKDPFKIVVYSFQKNFNNIDQLILSYLIQNKYSFENQNLNIRYLKAQLTEFHNEIAIIDSLQSLINNRLASNLTNSLDILFDPAPLIKERRSIKLSIENINEKLKDPYSINNFIVMKNLTPQVKPVSSKTYYTFKLGLIFFIVGFISLRIFKK